MAKTIDEADGMKVGDEPVPGMRLRCICRGHTGPIGRIAWSPCGQFIASPSKDKTVRVWDAKKGREVSAFKRHDNATVSVDWSADGDVIASISDDRIRTWNAKTTFQASEYRSRSGSLTCVGWSPSGELIVAGTDSGRLVTWNGVNEHAHNLIDTQRRTVRSIGWGPDGRIFAVGFYKSREIWVLRAHRRFKRSMHLWSASLVTRFTTLAPATSIQWTSNGKSVIVGDETNNVRLLQFRHNSLALRNELEGNTAAITSVSVSADGKLISSRAIDGSVRVWDRETLNMLAVVHGHAGGGSCNAAFNPYTAELATPGPGNSSICIWEIDEERLVSESELSSVRYASAKVAILGESNVGKSCLAMRLAEDRYPEEHEHGTTHGMRFWPMEAEELHPAAKPPEGQRRDVVLWDFGGQDEYQLVHQMFLHDTTLALVLIDPTRGRAAMDEARDWNKRLEKHLGKVGAVKLLVGTKVDKNRDLIDQMSIDALRDECGFAKFLDLSAKTGRNINELRQQIAKVLDWDQIAKTSRPELFQHIRDDIEARRKDKQIVLTLASFKEAIKKSAARIYEEAAVDAVSDQLATQGIIVRTKLTGGDDALVLQLPVIERYAGSLIVAARNNPRGVPALETSELGSPRVQLPGLEQGDRGARKQERMVLEAVTELMIEHGLCFRHEGLLVFPTLLRATETSNADELPGSVSLYYDFSGAIGNVYASLISWLVIGQGFGRIRLWENRVEFDASGRGACGLRKVSRGGGFAHLDVYFHGGTPTETRTEFISFVHQHLRSSGIDVVEHFELICGNADCRYEFEREVVQNRMAKGEKDVVCPQCETRVGLSEGFRQERERDEQAEQKSFALMTRVREDVPKIVASVKQRAFGRSDAEYQTDRPLRILHLSDLHFTADTTPETKLQWLDDDIRKGSWLEDDLDYVVISGDMTHQGNNDGFQRASRFVSLLIERFDHLSAERFVLVPGNHDVQELDEAYDWRMNIVDAEKESAIQEGRLWGLPNDRYNDRLKAFSEQFHHPLLQKPYPLDPAKQGVVLTFPETRVQFLTLNSCWQIDQFHRTRASVHADAVAHMLHEADRQIERASTNTDITSDDYLRVGVWHHPVSHPERSIGNPEFLDHLMNHNVKVCLTGDIHEMSRDVIRHWHADRMYVVGAGSFGANEAGLEEGSPRLYNLLEVERDFSRIRVHTRQQPKPDGGWKGYAEWPMPGHSEALLPYFDISLE